MQSIANRPRLTIEPTPTDRVVEAAAVAGLAFAFATVALYWPALPERVPTHFGFAGKPDAWGTKSSLWFLPGMLAVLYIVMTVVCRFPHVFNYPVPITPENAESQYRIALEAIRWLKMECIWILAYLNWQVIQVALGSAEDLGVWFVPVTLAVVLGTSLVFIIRAYRAR